MDGRRRREPADGTERAASATFTPQPSEKSTSPSRSGRTAAGKCANRVSTRPREPSPAATHSPTLGSR